MYIGEQLGDLSDRKLTWAAQLGVEHVAVNTLKDTGIQNEDGTWNVPPIRALQRRLAEFGITMDVLNLGIEAAYYQRQRFPDLWTGGSGRDRAIDLLVQNIRAAGEATVPCLKYNCNVIGILRTGRTPGRGGATYSHFDVEKWTERSLTPLGPMPAEKLWENAVYVLERVVPVAGQCGVRLAVHPHDPALPREDGLRGVHSILGTVEGMKRWIRAVDSPYSGFNFCQGTVAEMCRDPRTEVLEAIRYFGREQRIFMVHLRNIKGGYLNFEEVYPDNGDVDFYEALRVYREVGYRGMLCPDHVPHSEADPDNERQHSFALGYTKGLIDALSRS
ncbi:MAG TPA: mannonate dehydratase [Chloroflexota bacterium]|jgi:mannonate dehydratase|nr:mannonate dehydratase [Chloroflexota bacterium]